MGINANNVLRLLNQKQETREERILRLAAEKRAQQNKTTAVASAAPNTTNVAADDNRFFKKGAFSDGYQFGDITKTILGTLHDVSENVTEAVFDATENLIDTTAYGVGAIGGLFDKDFQDKTGQFIAKEILKPKQMGETVATYGQPTGWINLLVNGGKTEENSVLGDKADGLVQSGAHLAGSAALQLVGVPAWLTMGVNAFGGEIESALQQDATYAEAGISGGISAAAEILFERLSSGVKILKGTTADEGLQQLLRTNIKNKLSRTIAKYALDAVGEGTEEVLTEAASAVGRKMTYLKDKEWNEILSREDLFDAFVGGAVMSGVLGGGRMLRSAKTGRDYTTGLTANEEKVVNKLYQDELAEREKSGKLTAGEKSKIYDGIVEQMEQGRVSTDTIESVLGGDTYKGYQSRLEQESKLQKEIEELESIADNAITVKQRERLAEARKQLEELDVKGAKSSLFDQVDKMTAKDTKLRESYNERVRKGQAFEADLTKYDAKQQETVKKAVESGILNNSNRTHEFVDLIAKISADKGVPFDFANNAKLKESGFAIDGKQVNGFVTADGVTVNVNSAKALNSVVGHEITHVLEGTELYNELQSAIVEYAKSKGDYQGRYDTLAELYKDIDGANIDAELTADLVGDYLFTDIDFLKRLSAEHRNVFQKLYDEIKYLCKVATAGSKEAKELEKVKKLFEEAYRTETKNPTADGGVKYALGLQNPTNTLTQYDYTKSFADQINDFQNGKFPARDTLMLGGTPKVLKEIGLIGLPMTINQKHIGDALNGTYKGTHQEVLDHTFTPKELATLPEKIADPIAVIYDKRTGKANASESTVDVIVEMTAASGKQVLVAVQVGGNSHINGLRIDTNKVATVHGNTDCLTRLVDAINETEKGNVAVFYINNDKTTKVLQSAGNPIPRGLSNLDGFINSINDPGSPVKSRFSNVTETQQFKRWFGDWQNHPENASKVVNSDGTPKVMYHGSPEQFTVFDRSKAKGSGLYGRGFYFTDSESQASVYGNEYSVYLDVKHPLQYGGKTVSRDQVRSFLEAVSENEDYSIENYGTYDVDSILNIVMGSNQSGDAFQIIQDISTTAIGDMVEAAELFNSINKTEFDGIIVPTETVVFRPEQVKSATDNIGTFDGNNPDIRYSLSKQDVLPAGEYRITGEDIARMEQERIATAQNAPRNDIDELGAPTREDIAKMERDAETTANTKAVTKPLISYPIEKQKTIRSYLQSVDEQIKSLVKRVKGGDLRFERQKVADVSERAAADIKGLLGIDVSGYTHNINTSGVKHILNRHGENGKQDTTMAIDDDIARVGWVLDNYDSVELLTKDGEQIYSGEFKDENNQPVPQIRFIKKIDGTYYVVEAAYENEYKKLWVQSTYLQKNEDVTQVSAEGHEANHKTYAQGELASPSSSYSIPENGSGVKYSVGEPVVEELDAQTSEDIARAEAMRMEAEKELHGPWRMTDPLDQKVEKLFRMMLREEVSEQDYMAQLVKADRQYQQRGGRVEEALERVREAYSKEATATPEIEKKVERLTRKVLHEGIMGRMKDALAEKKTRFTLNRVFLYLLNPNHAQCFPVGAGCGKFRG